MRTGISSVDGITGWAVEEQLEALPPSTAARRSKSPTAPLLPSPSAHLLLVQGLSVEPMDGPQGGLGILWTGKQNVVAFSLERQSRLLINYQRDL